jgi:hypothetical protein
MEQKHTTDPAGQLRVVVVAHPLSSAARRTTIVTSRGHHRKRFFTPFLLSLHTTSLGAADLSLGRTS